MPDMIPDSSYLSEMNFFAKLVSDAVTSSVSDHLNSVYFRIGISIVSILASAIAYMYLTQKVERKRADEERREANNRLHTVLGEATRLMESVKNGLETSAVREGKTRKALEKVSKVLLGCVGRDSRLDNKGIDIDDETE